MPHYVTEVIRNVEGDIESKLAPYGINRQNVEENWRRFKISCIVQGYYKSDNIVYRSIEDFWVDDDYAFTIKNEVKLENGRYVTHRTII